MPNYDDTNIYFSRENVIFNRVQARAQGNMPCRTCAAEGEDYHDPECPEESCPVCMRHSMDKEEVKVEIGTLEDLQVKHPDARLLLFSGIQSE